MEFLRISCLLLLTTLLIIQSSSLDEINWNLENPTKEAYSAFLSEIRNKVKDKNLDYGGTKIPVIGAPSNTYFRVNLISPMGNVVLGVKRDDLYVVAYLAKYGQQREQAYFFKDEIDSAQIDKLFPEAKGAANQRELEYTESYFDLRQKSGKNRKQAGLGVNKLLTYMRGVTDEVRDVKAEATFLMVAAGMVSEGTRFSYIEELVLDHFPNGFTPDDKVIILENNWGKISEDIKDSKNGVFKKPSVYKSNEASTTLTVSNAAEIGVAVLKHVKDVK